MHEREREREKKEKKKKKCIKFNMKDTFNDMTQHLPLHKDIQNR